MTNERPVATHRYRVEELSARTGLPVRTIREYQTWKLLHPPAREGRIGWYDESHVRRLETIGQLQRRGYSIAGIRDLLEAWASGSDLDGVLGEAEDPPLAAIDEVPAVLTRQQLARLVPDVAASPRLLRRLVGTGVIVGDGERFIARSPALVTLVAEAIKAGLSPTEAIEVGGAIVSAAGSAGTKVAAAMARLAEVSDADAIEPLFQRGRLLMSRAMASHTIDQVGQHLVAQAANDADLAAIIERVRIGASPRQGTEPG